MSVIARALESVRQTDPIGLRGSVAALRGLTLLVDDLPASIGSLVRIEPRQESGAGRFGEIVGFDGPQAIVMMLDSAGGICSGDPVTSEQTSPTVGVGASLLGRVINGLGRPIDSGPEPHDLSPMPVHPPPVAALERTPIQTMLPTGVRAIDLFTTVGKGQRLGIFAGPGVGKSTLLGMIARRSSAKVNVIALVGERGREVRDFIERSLGEDGLARSVIVVATSDEAPLMRVRAALVACAAAEHFRDQGHDVMLMLDSLTRFAHAQRQIGLAVGEPPATKGYTPSVFAMMPALLERAGVTGRGSITAFYTILVEADDVTEPVSDSVRGILDGHVMLSRAIANRGHYPAIDVLDSVSRIAPSVIDEDHAAARRRVVQLLSALGEVEDLVQIGAYASGSNPTADIALSLREEIDQLLQQDVEQISSFYESKDRLLSLARQARPAQGSSRDGSAPDGPRAPARRS